MVAARTVHLVGSIPADSAELAMGEALARLGDRLLSLPDGETGERRDWIASVIRSLGAHPAFELTRDGDYSDYDHTVGLRVRRGHRLLPEQLDFGYVLAFKQSYPVFERLRDGRADLRFQVGLPGDLDLAMFALGLAGGLRHRRVFADVLVREITRIHALAGPSVVFQLELPGELVLVSQLPGPARSAMAASLARGVVRLVGAAPAGSRFGIHLCVGDLGNKAMGRLADAGPPVVLANAIAARWPMGRTLDFIHVPLAAGDRPAPLAEDFYRPLSRLRLPPGVRFVAGFVHEKRNLVEHRAILELVERHAGRRVDLATACGLGRRRSDAAYRTMDLAAELACA